MATKTPPVTVTPEEMRAFAEELAAYSDNTHPSIEEALHLEESPRCGCDPYPAKDTCEHVLNALDAIEDGFWRRVRPAVEEAFRLAAEEVLNKGRAEDDPQLEAIRALFTNPKPVYTVDDLLVLYGGDRQKVTDAQESEQMPGQPLPTSFSARTAAVYLSDVSHLAIARALDGMDTPMTLETVTLQLPRWFVEGLRRVAAAKNQSISEVVMNEFNFMAMDGWSNEEFAQTFGPETMEGVLVGMLPAPKREGSNDDPSRSSSARKDDAQDTETKPRDPLFRTLIGANIQRAQPRR